MFRRPAKYFNPTLTSIQNWNQQFEDNEPSTQHYKPEMTQESLKWKANHKYTNQIDMNKNLELHDLKMTEREKRLTQLVMALYFRKLSKLIESK